MRSNVHPNTSGQPDKTTPHVNRLLRWTDVQPLVGICRSHAHQLAAKGLFPKPRKIVAGGRASAWSEHEILEWISQCVAESRDKGEDTA